MQTCVFRPLVGLTKCSSSHPIDDWMVFVEIPVFLIPVGTGMEDPLFVDIPFPDLIYWCYCVGFNGVVEML